jgi:hypothetical protein
VLNESKLCIIPFKSSVRKETNIVMYTDICCPCLCVSKLINLQENQWKILHDITFLKLTNEFAPESLFSCAVSKDLSLKYTKLHGSAIG